MWLGVFCSVAQHDQKNWEMFFFFDGVGCNNRNVLKNLQMLSTLMHGPAFNLIFGFRISLTFFSEHAELPKHIQLRM